ncbi:RNA polymerase sigma factor [Streptomyces sp. NRRL B-24085]|uniref:RNA polymerase sigma factor n=1 Tax=Streptomyces sp. NRRL B-24085 TaxID=1709476 RepID=UPI000A43A38C|nr:SigE family RNA polymerase sigma factor [Streptomyces sp. NRRL B-24085]
MRTATIPTAAPSVTWWQNIRGLMRGGLVPRSVTHQKDGGNRVFAALSSRTAAAGDEHGFSELYHHRRLPLVRLALLLVDDLPTAEDVVQDAFTALLRRHGRRLATLEDPEAYLRTSVVNGARSVLRRRRTARAYIPERERQLPSADHSVLLAETHQEVIDALQRLTRRQREVLVLRYWADLTEAQIADTLGVSRGTVKSTASRALDALGRHLEEIPR